MGTPQLKLVSLTTVVEVQDDRLALVHIPLDLYPYFLNPILQVLFHEVPPIEPTHAELKNGSRDGTRHAQPAFLNLSITPVECSIMCPRQLANKYFAPLVNQFIQDHSSSSSRLSISQDDFIAMQVYGEGLEAGQRVLELTSPLALAGISIFFISTYYSDYIIVPLRNKKQVIDALEKRGFQFEKSTDAFINHNQNQFNSCYSPVSSRSGSSLGSPPATPPPSTLEELQARTFASLRKNHIVPSVDTSLRLVQCAAHHPYSSDASSISILRTALTTTLVVDKPRFLSLTLTAADPAASLLLEQRLLPRFSADPASLTDADNETSLLLGSKEDILVPIMLDLRKLPLEATGIVCGVASRLADATHAVWGESSEAFTPTLSRSFNGTSSFSNTIDRFFSSSVGSGGPVRPPNHAPGRDSPIDGNSEAFTATVHHLQPDLDASINAVEISFLSTARAGTIIVGEHELHRAVDALEAENHEPEMVTGELDD
ncbi:ACT domain-containing protein [Aspergillus clavatus NRRL 1]|uniref:CASTOR ACT domain-containing protein n=1 Tax=Aspergillus clavatus (strain ATCC 1007 / CBS 513.65 / DSM 816 / NCTC 3887 / NRRL 1 / QM 1276 / 107) TaxID=344612 RepID=A1C530_ASPCL|nr:uncharacterized protein ACLA_002090 [Aspergillus clavatus NRRL 1]EAW14798.1 conserved hypothetical protein [Aspergillus clavatus NRRL 1]